MKPTKQIRYAVVFPGQGSQYVGMGQEIAEQFSSALEIFKSAEQFTGLKIRHLSFLGPEEELMKTSVTQPCLLSASLASYAALQEHFDRQPDFICGHSAGEYAGLVAAGVLSFSDAIRLIQLRGSLMSKMQAGGMLALKGVTPDESEELCQISVLPGGTLVLANWNSPTQIVLSGDSDSIESAIFNGLDRGIKVVPLTVSGAFHSPLMLEAATQFSSSICDAQFNTATIPVVSNVTAKPVISGCEWRLILQEQMTSPVLWEPLIRYLEQQDVKVFVEVGPGKVLSKLIKQIVPSAITLNVEDISSLQLTVSELEKVFLAKVY